MKVPSQRGQPSYFIGVQDAFAHYERKLEGLEVNSLTGSILLRGDDLDLESLTEFGEERELFKIKSAGHNPSSLPLMVASPIQGLSNQVSGITRGWLDLSGIAFLTLLGIGLHQIRKGNIGMPPWYTAFWYAFGVFTKSLIEKK
jgi:hypothetical protein